MSALTDYTRTIAELINQYEHGELTYNQANVVLDEETDALLRNYLVDTPDAVLEASFDAYAHLQVSASEQQDITQSEASNLIYTRAESIFDKSRPPEAIEELCKPFENAIFGDDNNEDLKSEAADNSSPLDGFDENDTNWFGPFSLN